jgi:hypothetical protein
MLLNALSNAKLFSVKDARILLSSSKSFLNLYKFENHEESRLSAEDILTLVKFSIHNHLTNTSELKFYNGQKYQAQP